MKQNNEFRRLRREVRAMKKEIKNVNSRLDRYDRIDELIADMKRSAREMLLMSREL